MAESVQTGADRITHATQDACVIGVYRHEYKPVWEDVKIFSLVKKLEILTKEMG